ncbi:unnamed protein product [Effrenium voratum]|uniref:Uncharacterized protein n=1 Tax=Effrenium voratum TaxID=2562239 RepID=A0AA36ICI9_9DINO|nr:unnamed protein product [Effrenium voratum]
MGFGKSEKGKLEMDIADVRVVTDIFVAWGHQQEKDSPLTVHEIAERFDKLYQDVGGPTRSAMAVEAQSAATHCASHVSEPGARTLTILTMPREPRVRTRPEFRIIRMKSFDRYMAQQAAMAAYQQQLVQMYASFPASGKFGKAAKGKGPGPAPVGVPRAEPPASGAAALPADVPDADVPDADADDEEAKEEATADFAPPKPRLLQIVDPHSGKPIDTMGMNFAPRKPSTPLQITNPNTGEAVMKS